jgi:hypothetical protein
MRRVHLDRAWLDRGRLRRRDGRGGDAHPCVPIPDPPPIIADESPSFVLLHCGLPPECSAIWECLPRLTAYPPPCSPPRWDGPPGRPPRAEIQRPPGHWPAEPDDRQMRLLQFWWRIRPIRRMILLANGGNGGRVEVQPGSRPGNDVHCGCDGGRRAARDGVPRQSFRFDTNHSLRRR